MEETQFEPFPSISRLSRDCIITEKIDGTNGVIYVADDFETMLVGSRSQWITPEKDNAGFARWAYEHKDELVKGLGPGRHYGEWWGAGIQRKYGLAEKRFSLFNTTRWTDDVRPACCHVVPTLYAGNFDTDVVNTVLAGLWKTGSIAAPGFMKPEGVVVFHAASKTLFKKTFKGDGRGKSYGA